MSNGYDVTIFDGCPPVLKETEKEYIFKGVSRTMKEKEYLPQDYSCPTITIASMGERIGQNMEPRTTGFVFVWMPMPTA